MHARQHQQHRCVRRRVERRAIDARAVRQGAEGVDREDAVRPGAFGNDVAGDVGCDAERRIGARKIFSIIVIAEPADHRARHARRNERGGAGHPCVHEIGAQGFCFVAKARAAEQHSVERGEGKRFRVDTGVGVAAHYRRIGPSQHRLANAAFVQRDDRILRERLGAAHRRAGDRVQDAHAQAAGRCSPLICVRCMTRRFALSNGSRRCMVQRLSHSTRSPTRQRCVQAISGRVA